MIERFTDIGEDNEIIIFDEKEDEEIGYWDFLELVNNINVQNEAADEQMKIVKSIVAQDEDATVIIDELKKFLDKVSTDCLF